jgi:hypothetical protein
MKSSSTVRMLIIGMVVLALISASAMAISKSDLISSYKSQSGSSPSKPMISPTSPSPASTIPSAWVTPTPVPSSGKSLFPSWFVPSSWEIPSKSNTPFTRPTIYPTPTPTPTPSPAPTPHVLKTCPPDLPVGELHFNDWMRYTDANNPGVYLYEAVDDSGQYFRVGRGCPCNCTYYERFGDEELKRPCDSLFK